MERKRVFYSEWAYVLGLVALALGTALMERADFGMSMVVAPAYLLHLRVARRFVWFSFGMAEYVFQALLILALSLALRRFRKGYLFSFVTAVVYGLTLDGAMAVVGLLPPGALPTRFACFSAGLALCALGVVLLFHTYIAPEAYELVVKELSTRFGWRIDRVKTAYDCLSCLAGVMMSFAFFGLGRFEGVKAGTIFCALVNGWLIGRASAWLEATFVFRDALPLRELFEK